MNITSPSFSGIHRYPDRAALEQGRQQFQTTHAVEIQQRGSQSFVILTNIGNDDATQFNEGRHPEFKAGLNPGDWFEPFAIVPRDGKVNPPARTIH